MIDMSSPAIVEDCSALVVIYQRTLCPLQVQQAWLGYLFVIDALVDNSKSAQAPDNRSAISEETMVRHSLVQVS